MRKLSRSGTHSHPPGVAAHREEQPPLCTLLQGWQPLPARSSPISYLPATGPAMPAVQPSMAVLTTADLQRRNWNPRHPPCSPPKHQPDHNGSLRGHLGRPPNPRLARPRPLPSGQHHNPPHAAETGPVSPTPLLAGPPCPSSTAMFFSRSHAVLR